MKAFGPRLARYNPNRGGRYALDELRETDVKKVLFSAIAAVMLVGGAAQAAGDAAAGEKIFAQKCRSCHMIVDKDGKDIVKGGKAGPNQYGLIGGTAAHDDTFKGYSDGLKAMRAAGFVWTEADVVEYLVDTNTFLQAKTGDSKARSKMAFKLPKEDERANVAAYLAQFSH